MYYRKENQIDVYDVDHNGAARLSALMRYMQSCAEAQLAERGMSYNELKEKRRAFILSRIKIEFTDTVKDGERISCLTFPCDSRGYSFFRCYAVEKNGIAIGRAVSVWALIDTENRSLVRVNNFELGLETHEPHDLALGRFSFPAEALDIGEYRVRYSDIDRNGHMNNTRYPDMYSDFLPLDGRRIHTITINYLNEARPRERLRIQMARGRENIYYIRSIREDGLTNSEAEILLTEI